MEIRATSPNKIYIMTATIVPNQTHQVILKPLVNRQPVFRPWKEELDYLEAEVNFYCQLLKMGILNGRNDKKEQLFSMLEICSQFRDEQLPELKSLLGQELITPEARREAAITAMEKLERINSNLKKLKLSVFPFVHQIQTYSIW